MNFGRFSLLFLLISFTNPIIFAIFVAQKNRFGEL